MPELPQVTFNEDGSAIVKIGDSQWHWPVDQVSNAIKVARVCMESRKTRQPCDCICCCVYAAKTMKLPPPATITPEDLKKILEESKPETPREARARRAKMAPSGNILYGMPFE